MKTEQVQISREEYEALLAVSRAAQYYIENFFGYPSPNERAMIKAVLKLKQVQQAN